MGRLPETLTLPTGGARARLPKRAFDFVVSGLRVLFSAPLWGLIALVIKLDDGGPIFYGQSRIGQDGQVFRVLKFRSM